MTIWQFIDLDWLWERAKKRWPQLGLWDQTYDQSHVQHTLVCVLVFGTLGMLTGAFARGWSWQLFTVPLAIGIAAGWLFYIVREVAVRVPRWRYNVWDGTLDIIVPIFVTGPWATLSLRVGAGVPAWSGALLYLFAIVIAWMYTFGRPGILHYDVRKDA